MHTHHAAAMLRTALLALVVSVGSAQAQQPSAAAIAVAKDVIIVKGAHALWDPIVAGVIEQVRRTFLQSNPMLAKDLSEVATKLRAEFAPRTSEILNAAAKRYATRFTEPELKEMLAFYKSRLGQKMIKEEPLILDETMKSIDPWAQKLSEEVVARMRAEMKRRGHEI